MDYNRIFKQVNRVTLGFFFPYFFFNPARFQLRVNPLGRPGPELIRWAGPDFKTMKFFFLCA
jgi:hypothetical protein